MSNNNNLTSTATNTGGNTPWGWLGLLKWSLAYSDGTSESMVSSPMSQEDKEFLEKVMKEGIIDENERMKEILKLVTKHLDNIRTTTSTTTTTTTKEQQQQGENENITIITDLLQELRDIVEQIDYARAFAAMKGLQFLLGCIQQNEISARIHVSCLNVLSTMAANNPPIQKELLEMGSIKILSDIFINKYQQQQQLNENQNENENSTEDNRMYCAKIMQTLSASVRSYELSEQVFCSVEQAKQIIYMGLQQQPSTSTTTSSSSTIMLQRRTLFFLRALITSDYSTPERVKLFAHSIAYVADNLILPPPETATAAAANNNNNNNNHDTTEIREIALSLLLQILEQQKSVNTILARKEHIVSQGVQRIASLRDADADADVSVVELETWENLLIALSRATPDSPDSTIPPNPEVAPQ